MKFIITGATGFIGRWLIKGLKERGHDCVAIVRNGRINEVQQDPVFFGVNIVALEMEEYRQIGKRVYDADCLINLAWEGSRGNDRMDAAMQEHNYVCTMEAIKGISHTGCRCVVTAGSQAEYGNIAGKITEETKPVPNTEYGKSKLRLFEWASMYCRNEGIRLIEPRYFSLYGPGDSDKTMIVSMLKKMRCNEECELTRSIQMWDFLYIENAVEKLIMLITAKKPGGVYNFASGDCRPLREFIEEMKFITGSSSFLNYGAVPYPKTGMVSIEPDITKLKSAIEWNNMIAFREGIIKVVESIYE